MGVCLRVLKESNKSRFDSYSVRKSVLIISHITFRDCRVHSFSDNLSRNSCRSQNFKLTVHSSQMYVETSLRTADYFRSSLVFLRKITSDVFSRLDFQKSPSSDFMWRAVCVLRFMFIKKAVSISV